jgi:hypothetical protein
MQDDYNDDDEGEEKKETNAYYNREINKYGKKKSIINYRPTVSILNKLLKDEPENFYADDQGRLYGIVQDEENPVYADLLAQGQIDNGSSLLFFVWLPHLMKGTFAKSKKKNIGSFANLSEDEILIFPSESDMISLRSYNDYSSDPILTIYIRYYPERIGRNSRSALVVCDTSN